MTGDGVMDNHDVAWGAKTDNRRALSDIEEVSNKEGGILIS